MKIPVMFPIPYTRAIFDKKYKRCDGGCWSLVYIGRWEGVYNDVKDCITKNNLVYTDESTEDMICGGRV